MKNFINFLPPWVETNIQPAFYDKESGSVLQQTARMYAKVNQLVRIANEQYETIQDYINRFIELKDYVEDYFANLDVQEEINNKLDAMVEDGTLQEIVAEYLQSNVTWTFDNVADMKAATNLIDGSYARTLGYYQKGDNGGGLYYISDTGTADEASVIAITSGVYAHLVYEGSINVKQFGAKGDGLEDDSSALAKAFAYRSNEETVINLNSNETYLIDGNIYLYSNTLVNGNGCIIKDAAGSPSSESFNKVQFLNNRESVKVSGYNSLVNFEINDINFDGNQGGVTFAIFHGNNIKFNNLKFNNGFVSTHVLDLGGCKNVYVNGCSFVGNLLSNADNNYREVIQTDYADVDGMPYWGEDNEFAFDELPCEGVFLDNCYFNKNDNDTYFLNAIGTHRTPLALPYHKNVQIRNCEFHDCEFACIRCPKIDGLVVENNVFYDEHQDDTRSRKAAILVRGYFDYSNKNIWIKNNILKHGNGNGTLGFCEIMGANSSYLNDNIWVENNTVTGIFSGTFDKDYCEFIRIGNIQEIHINGNIADHVKHFITVIANAQTVKSLISTNNEIRYTAQYIHTAASYADSGTCNLTQSGNVWVNATGRISFNNFEAYLYISEDIAPPDSNTDNLQIKFTASSNPFIEVTNDGYAVLPEFIKDFVTNGQVTYYSASGTALNRGLTRFVYNTSGAGTKYLNPAFGVAISDGSYTMRTEEQRYTDPTWKEGNKRLTFRCDKKTTDTTKYGSGDVMYTFLKIKGC